MLNKIIDKQSVQYISLKQLLPAYSFQLDTHTLAENAKKQLIEAKQQAAAILEEAKRQTEILKNEAFKKGYQEGFSKGEESSRIEVQKERDSLINFLQNAIKEVSSLKSKILKDIEPEIIQLALKLAEKLVLNSFQIHPEAIASIIKDLIKKVEDEEEIKILVNPSALPILEEYLQPKTEDAPPSSRQVGERSEPEVGQLLLRGLGDCKLKIEGDEKISEGGCLIVTDTKILDAQIETRISEATKTLELTI